MTLFKNSNEENHSKKQGPKLEIGPELMRMNNIENDNEPWLPMLDPMEETVVLLKEDWDAWRMDADISHRWRRFSFNHPYLLHLLRWLSMRRGRRKG
jgi:hypothetical protein